MGIIVKIIVFLLEVIWIVVIIVTGIVVILLITNNVESRLGSFLLEQLATRVPCSGIFLKLRRMARALRVLGSMFCCSTRIVLRK